MRAAWVLLLAAWAALGYDCCNGKVCNSNWDAYDSATGNCCMLGSGGKMLEQTGIGTCSCPQKQECHMGPSASDPVKRVERSTSTLEYVLIACSLFVVALFAIVVYACYWTVCRRMEAMDKKLEKLPLLEYPTGARQANFGALMAAPAGGQGQQPSYAIAAPRGNDDETRRNALGATHVSLRSSPAPTGPGLITNGMSSAPRQQGGFYLLGPQAAGNAGQAATGAGQGYVLRSGQAVSVGPALNDGKRTASGERLGLEAKQ